MPHTLNNASLTVRECELAVAARLEEVARLLRKEERPATMKEVYSGIALVHQEMLDIADRVNWWATHQN